ncbi:MAG: hypothetical protein JNL12_03385 [Planctomycetes bacterium]|nr:hypothetical protein [Planctomycetota bacterium]
MLRSSCAADGGKWPSARSGTVLWLLLALLARLPAQQGERVPTFLRVEDHLGRPLVGAEVTFAGGHPHLGLEGAATDQWVVQSDARGRAQAKLQPGLCYVAWAIGPVDGDGARAVSPVAAWFGAGALVTLRCEPPAHGPQLVLTGTEAWTAHGPLRWVLGTPQPGPEFALESANGALRLPFPAFDPGLFVEVRTADDQPLLVVPANTERLEVPPPQRVRVRVAHGDGTPAPGVRLRQRIARVPMWNTDGGRTVTADRWRDLGVTDAEGRCVVTVAYASDPLRSPGSSDLVLFAFAEGRAAVCGGVWRLFVRENGARVRNHAGDELAFVLPEPSPLVGSLGPAARGARVQLDVVGKLDVENGSYRHDPRSYHTVVGDDGSFAFATVPADVHSLRLVVVERNGPPLLFPSSPERVLPQLQGLDALTSLGELQVRVATDFGAPARGLVVFLVPYERMAMLVRDSLLRLPLDARGETSARVPCGRWLVVALDATGSATEVVQVGEGRVTSSLTLQPLVRARFELRDEQQRPVAGARVRASGTSMRGDDEPLQNVLYALRSRWTRDFAALRSGPDGRVEVPFVGIPGVAQKVRMQAEGAEAVFEGELAEVEGWTTLRPR